MSKEGTMFSSIANAVRSLLGASTTPKSSARLEKDLNKALRAEDTPVAHNWDNHSYKSILHQTYAANIGDGV
jgi:hypothetical protein